MAPARLEPSEIRLLAKWILSLQSEGGSASPGNAARGRELYATKSRCEQCHAIRGIGGAYGPDLTSIGRQRGPAYLRQSLTDPNAALPESFLQYRWFVQIPDDFLFVTAVLAEGAEVSGARINEDLLSIQLREPSGRIRSLLKSELRDLQKHRGYSPMPSYSSLTSEELDDLVAYLCTLRGSL